MSYITDRDVQYWEMDTTIQNTYMEFIGHRLTWEQLKQNLEELLSIANQRIEEENRYGARNV